MPSRLLSRLASLLVLGCVGLLLGGCVSGPSRRQVELCKWVGRSETDLVQAMGAPARSYETDGVKILTYEDSRVDIIPGTSFYPGFGPYWAAGSSGLPPQAVNLKCDTNITVVGGAVKSFTLRGNACGNVDWVCPQQTAQTSHDRSSFKFDLAYLPSVDDQRLLSGPR